MAHSLGQPGRDGQSLVQRLAVAAAAKQRAPAAARAALRQDVVVAGVLVLGRRQRARRHVVLAPGNHPATTHSRYGEVETDERIILI